MPELTAEGIHQILKTEGHAPHSGNGYLTRYAIDDLSMFVKRGSKKSTPGIVLERRFADLCSILMLIGGLSLRGGYYNNNYLARHGNDSAGYLFSFDTEASLLGFIDVGSEYVHEGYLAATALVQRYATALPKTARESVVLIRVGQSDFRDRLIEFWSGCAVTGVGFQQFLRASHIKPWRSCNSRERLDVHNGLLLVPNLDVAFDSGLITFRNDGQLLRSRLLNDDTARVLGICDEMRLSKLLKAHLPYLTYHREHIFRDAG